MEKELIRLADINFISAYDDLEPVILMLESGEIYIDFVLPDAGKYWRLSTRQRVGQKQQDRVFKTLVAATKILLDHEFPEFTVKRVRKDLSAKNLHTNN